MPTPAKPPPKVEPLSKPAPPAAGTAQKHVRLLMYSVCGAECSNTGGWTRTEQLAVLSHSCVRAVSSSAFSHSLEK